MATYDIDIFQDIHVGKTCAIIGTGASILKLNEKSFHPYDVIIGLNDAIITIEKLKLPNKIYSMQKDFAVVRPQEADLLLSWHESREAFPDYPVRIIFDAVELWDGKNEWGYQEFSANCALMIATKAFGCKHLRLFGFDACTTGSLEKIRVNGSVGIGDDEKDDYNYVSGHYYPQCQRMIALIAELKLDVEWIA